MIIIPTAKMKRLAEAIASYEGFYVTEVEAKARKITWPTTPQRCNNPGDLIYMHQPKASPYIVTGKDGHKRQYAKFETVENGWQALYAQIRLDASRAKTLATFMAAYAPAEDANDPTSYTAFVGRMLGVEPTRLLSEIIA